MTDTTHFYSLEKAKRAALAEVERCERDMALLREMFRGECKQFYETARKETPGLARQHMDAYCIAEATKDAMQQAGRYPRECIRYDEILNYSQTEEAHRVSELWHIFLAIAEKWKALHPAPEGFWWGVGDPYGMPMLFGPREEYLVRTV